MLVAHNHHVLGSFVQTVPRSRNFWPTHHVTLPGSPRLLPDALPAKPFTATWRKFPRPLAPTKKERQIWLPLEATNKLFHGQLDGQNIAKLRMIANSNNAVDFKQRTWEILPHWSQISITLFVCKMLGPKSSTISSPIALKDQGWFLVHHGALRILGGYWQVGCYHAVWLYAHSCLGSLVFEHLWTSRFQRWNPAAESTL